MSSTSASSKQGRPPPKLSRQSHNKSRTGCGRCKARRIKCDETKPECNKCTTFGAKCDYNSANSSSQNAQFERSIFRNRNGPPLVGRRGRPRTTWCDADQDSSVAEEQLVPLQHVQKGVPYSIRHVDDIELLNHFITRENDCTTTTSGERDPLHDQALLLSFTYPSILHLVCEFSALELARHNPSRQDHFRSLAEKHSIIGLQGATDLIRQMDTRNCHAVYTAATFASINHFARGPRPGDYLLCSEAGLQQWLPLLQGIRTITEMVGAEKIIAGPLEKQHIESAPRATIPATIIFECPRIDWIDPFEHLKAFVASSNESESGADVHALERLACCFETTYGRGEVLGNLSHQTAFSWPYELGEEFCARLQEKRPVSMIIAAHFALLLQNFESIWFLQGWSDHILASIYKLLKEDYRVWLEWPIDQARWLRAKREGGAVNGEELIPGG
ncbi:hypothetical protein BU24DRAFT_363017 [Aaosphaeria arxii CBS 175.79]|uniref:Zn(2)-C6 fungal-type domain-containing protein n=1 Tax=Aaosphaeria arxii CBS 175.79 TaxID=1450172 RepID=A0A6A5Y9U4_9PLEO|nr:uncharacterized protein BU24DRAFT_363017 [Aaosphaeria arxii CBS 175.79]KAF2022026.1 hypothetical protein BU24DRAFT_363017 [Aaosphaeria arxii CBS 175.79]